MPGVGHGGPGNLLRDAGSRRCLHGPGPPRGHPACHSSLKTDWLYHICDQIRLGQGLAPEEMVWSPHLSSGPGPAPPGAQCSPSAPLPEPAVRCLRLPSFRSGPRPPRPHLPSGDVREPGPSSLVWASSLSSSVSCRVIFLAGVWALLRTGEFISRCPRCGAQPSMRAPCSNAGECLLGRHWFLELCRLQGPRDRPATCPSGSFTSLSFSRGLSNRPVSCFLSGSDGSRRRWKWC